MDQAEHEQLPAEPAADAAVLTEGEPAALDEQPVGPACTVCSAPIEPGQDWCLECGTALAPRRRRPGLRSAGAIAALALALLGGGVAAAYATLADAPPARRTQVQTIAQAAPVTATTPATVDPAPVTAAPVTPAAPIAPVTPATPVTPITPVTPVTPKTTPTTPTTTTTKPDPKPANPVVVLAAGAGSLYDPDARATASGDPQRAIDGDGGTSWFVTTPPGADMNVGYVIDIGASSALTTLKLATKTPGFSIKVLGATAADPPQSVGDSAWKLLGEAGSVDAEPAPGTAPAIAPADGDKPGDGKLTLKLDAAGRRYRQVLLYVVAPPADGATVRFTQIDLIA